MGASGAERTSYERALYLIVRGAEPLPAEVAPLDQCGGRVLAEDVVAGVNVPAYARSAVDGFAVRARDLVSATSSSPVILEIVGSSRPGEPASAALPARACVRVATGAALPDGADAVVMLEDVDELDQGSRRAVRFSRDARAGKHVITIGEDVRAGEVLLRRGRVLRAHDLGVAASLEVAALLVLARPRVEVLVTGNEIVPPGAPRGGSQIVDSNSVVIRELAGRDGAQVAAVRYLADDPAVLSATLRTSDADVILISGGSSVGAEDHAPRVLAELGQVLVRGVSIRPGGPTTFGRYGDKWVFLLPGHPLACLTAYELLAGPLLRVIGGHPAAWPHPVLHVPLLEPIESVAGRTDFVRVTLDDDGARPLRHHTGSSNLSAAVRADGAILIPSATQHLARGEGVRVFRF